MTPKSFVMTQNSFVTTEKSLVTWFDKKFCHDKNNFVMAGVGHRMFQMKLHPSSVQIAKVEDIATSVITA